jgi:hypothetical protein
MQGSQEEIMEMPSNIPDLVTLRAGMSEQRLLVHLMTMPIMHHQHRNRDLTKRKNRLLGLSHLIRKCEE